MSYSLWLVVISSENLLLNLYRDYKSPKCLTIALDHTYHILTDDYPTLLIGVTTPGNHAPTLVLVPVNTQSHGSLYSVPDIHATPILMLKRDSSDEGVFITMFLIKTPEFIL